MRVRLHHEHERPLLPGLHGLGGTSTACSVVRVSATSTNCPGHSALSALGNVALSWIVPVVGSTVLFMNVTAPTTRALAAVEQGLDLERCPRARYCLMRGEVLLGHGERHVDRPDLGDDDERVVLVGLHHVAGLHQQVAGAAVHGRRGWSCRPSCRRAVSTIASLALMAARALSTVASAARAEARAFSTAARSACDGGLAARPGRCGPGRTARGR